MADRDPLLGIDDAALLRLYAHERGITVSQAKHDLGVWAQRTDWRDAAKDVIRAKGHGRAAEETLARFRTATDG